MKSLCLLFLLLFFSAKLLAQSERTTRNPEGFTYSGVFQFTTEQQDTNSIINWGKLDMLFSLGTRFHRYDPVRKSDKKTVSAFSGESYYTSLGVEYKLFGFLSFVGSYAQEWQKIERYDGIDVPRGNLENNESHLGLQVNYDPFFISYEVGNWEMPHFYLNESDSFAREDLDIDVSIVRMGFRRVISDSLSLSFSIDQTEFEKLQTKNFGAARGSVFGLNILFLHNSGFGLKLREEEGKVRSSSYKYEFNSYSILPFVSFL